MSAEDIGKAGNELLRRQPTVPCKVSRGMFSNERVVVVDLPNGETISYLVDKSEVVVDQDPEVGTEVKGGALVHIVRHEGDSVVIQFPERYMWKGASRQVVPKGYLTLQGESRNL